MKSNYVIVNSIDKPVWRDFVDQHPQGNIFHTPEMFQVFERARGYRPLLYAVLGADGHVRALLTPVLLTLKDGLFRRLTTRSIVYGSALCTPDADGSEALAVLLKTYTQNANCAALFTELRNLSDKGAIQPVLERCGFHYEDHLDYLIDLNFSPDQLMQNIGSRTRQHIRRAIRKGRILVEQITDISLIKPWYELVRKSYASARIPLADISLFKAAFEVLHPKGMISFWLAHLDTVYVAASAELHYKDVTYGWYSGVDRAYAGESPGELLMWTVLKWAAQHGYKTYDFGGAGKPNEEYGVRDFKAKFGGKLVCYGRNIFIHAPVLLRLSMAGYRIVKGYFGLSSRRFV